MQCAMRQSHASEWRVPVKKGRMKGGATSRVATSGQQRAGGLEDRGGAGMNYWRSIIIQRNA